MRSVFDRVFGPDFRGRFDRHFKEMFDEPVHNEDFFSQTNWKLTWPVEEDANDPVEYKVVLISELTAVRKSLEEELNKLGAEGWELKVWDGSRAIFMRFVEDEDEAEESESEGV